MMTKFLAPLPDYIHDSDFDNVQNHNGNEPDYSNAGNDAALLREYQDALRNSNDALEQAEQALANVMNALKRNKELLER
jgi:hypothetical protein